MPISLLNPLRSGSTYADICASIACQRPYTSNPPQIPPPSVLKAVRMAISLPPLNLTPANSTSLLILLTYHVFHL